MLSAHGGGQSFDRRSAEALARFPQVEADAGVVAFCQQRDTLGVVCPNGRFVGVEPANEQDSDNDLC